MYRCEVTYLNILHKPIVDVISLYIVHGDGSGITMHALYTLDCTELMTSRSGRIGAASEQQTDAGSPYCLIELYINVHISADATRFADYHSPALLSFYFSAQYECCITLLGKICYIG